jgi:hypothetical protein
MKSTQEAPLVTIPLPGGGWMTFDAVPNPRLKAYIKRQKKSSPERPLTPRSAKAS